MRDARDPKQQGEADITVRREPRATSVVGRPPAQLAECDLAGFFEQSLDLLCVAGVDGYFRQLNPAWTRHLGWTVDELLARPFLDFVHPDDRGATVAEVAKLADGDDTTLFENRYRCRDGSYRWLRWSARALAGRQRIYASARDVTRQKRQEREIIEIVDREKERLGRELHDGLCQTLAGIAAFSSTLSRKLAADSEAAAAAVEITELLNDAISQAHDLAKGLSATGLKTGGLAGALEVLVQNVEALFAVTCTLECDGHLGELSPTSAAHLYRIAQEAVNNGISHGRAKRLEVRLSLDADNGLLCIRDDGVGLPEQDIETRGIGLHTMAYRARMIGASLQVRQRARGGTQVACVFPRPGTTE